MLNDSIKSHLEMPACPILSYTWDSKKSSKFTLLGLVIQYLFLIVQILGMMNLNHETILLLFDIFIWSSKVLGIEF